MDSPFRHFLITRFNVQLPTGKGPCVDPSWLEHRFELFQSYCLPSVRGQRCRDFTWLLLMDKRTPALYLEKLRATLVEFGSRAEVLLVGSHWRVDLCRHLGALADSPYEFLITTKLDNDDAVHRDFISVIQGHFARQDYAFLGFQFGYTYCRAEGRLRQRGFKGNPFASLIERHTASIDTVYVAKHTALSTKGPETKLRDPVAVLQIVHDRNLLNSARGRLVKDFKDVLSVQFNLPQAADDAFQLQARRRKVGWMKRITRPLARLFMYGRN